MDDTQAAVRWAITANFDSAQMDCLTAVVLRIMDGISKLTPGDQRMVLAAYDAVRSRPGLLFDSTVHDTIESAREYPTMKLLEAIHMHRMRAEAKIPPFTMNQFRVQLHQALFG